MADFILKLFKPIVKLISKLRIPYSVKRFDYDDYKTITEIIKVGDVLLTTTKGEIANIFNPSKFKHAALFVGFGKVIEATTTGVKFTNLTEFLFRKDRVLLGTYAIEIQPREIETLADQFLGRPYDFVFKADNYEKYCFEVVADILNVYGADIREVETILNKKAYTSDSFLLDNKFLILYDSK